jgi:solute carrier family 25 carnitine/acylcarnitine transporter 20/29
MTNNNLSYKNFLYGWFAGVNAVIVSHPIDTIKTNIQEKKFINFNFRTLYKGLSAPLIGVGFEKAIVFGVFESTRKYTNSDIISGALAGTSASFIVAPFERIKILLQTNQTISKNNFNKSYLFQGLSATFYRETPGFAIYFATYNYLKNNYLYKKNISPLESFTFGAIAGSSAWLFIYPQDRIKTHIQAVSDRKLSFYQGFIEIYKDGGYKGFYRGFHYALMRAIPLHATAFMTVEICKKIDK